MCWYVHRTYFPELMLCFRDKFSLWKAVFYPAFSRNKSAVKTPITYFINQKQKHVSIRHNSILTLMKFRAPSFRIDIMHMIYLDVKYFSEVCLSIYYEKHAVKTTHRTMGHSFVKKWNFCPSDIIWNSSALKYQCFKHT